MTSWIFQGNMDRYDIDAYLRQTNYIYWSVSIKRYQNLIQKGDIVFIWRARGQTDLIPGIVAHGYVVEPCQDKSKVKHPEYLFESLWNDLDSETSEVKAGIKIIEHRLSLSDGMIDVGQIKSDALLSQIQIVKSRVGSNFLISEEVAERLMELWKLNASKEQIIGVGQLEGFKVGEVYRRRDLHKLFGGQQQGGISMPAKFSHIFLFTGESGASYGYQDSYQPDGSYWYTGEGQIGDMEITRGNLAIVNSTKSNKELHLFEYIRTGYVRYVDEMVYLGHHNSQAPDKNGVMRRTIVFELAHKGKPTKENQVGKDISKVNVNSLWKRPIDEVRSLAVTSVTNQASVKQRKVNLYNRSLAVKVYVRRRAKGYCEGCGLQAPFVNKQGEPYLEPHHIIRRGDGGPDDPSFVAALCPNCHRRAHYANDAEIFNQNLQLKVSNLESG